MKKIFASLGLIVFCTCNVEGMDGMSNWPFAPGDLSVGGIGQRQQEIQQERRDLETMQLVKEALASGADDAPQQIIQIVGNNIKNDQTGTFTEEHKNTANEKVDDVNEAIDTMAELHRLIAIESPFERVLDPKFLSVYCGGDPIRYGNELLLALKDKQNSNGYGTASGHLSDRDKAVSLKRQDEMHREIAALSRLKLLEGDKWSLFASSEIWRVLCVRYAIIDGLVATANEELDTNHHTRTTAGATGHFIDLGAAYNTKNQQEVITAYKNAVTNIVAPAANGVLGDDANHRIDSWNDALVNTICLALCGSTMDIHDATPVVHDAGKPADYDGILAAHPVALLGNKVATDTAGTALAAQNVMYNGYAGGHKGLADLVIEREKELLPLYFVVESLYQTNWTLDAAQIADGAAAIAQITGILRGGLVAGTLRGDAGAAEKAEIVATIAANGRVNMILDSFAAHNAAADGPDMRDEIINAVRNHNLENDIVGKAVVKAATRAAAQGGNKNVVIESIESCLSGLDGCFYRMFNAVKGDGDLNDVKDHILDPRLFAPGTILINAVNVFKYLDDKRGGGYADAELQAASKLYAGGMGYTGNIYEIILRLIKEL